ncbi:MAG: hypothetical protein ACOX1O_00375 [Eggerthellaceae bacterium]
MADRVIDPQQTEVPEMDDLLQRLLQYLVREARGRMEADQGFAPFVGVAVKDALVLEEIEGEEPDDVYRMAKHTVEGTRGAQAYGLCYDGYIDTDDGQRDAIIAEGGMAGQPEGYAICLLYDADPEKGTFNFIPPLSYVGMAPNFMAFLTDDAPASASYDDEELQADDVEDEEVATQESDEQDN